MGIELNPMPRKKTAPVSSSSTDDTGQPLIPQPTPPYSPPDQSTPPDAAPQVDAVRPSTEASPAISQDRPETLVQRLGDYLVETGALSPAGLEQALAHQKSQAPARRLLLGEALVELGLVDRQTLDRAVTRQLSSLHTALQETNRQLEQRVQQRTQDLERRLLQIRTAAEVTQLAITAPNLTDLLRRTTKLLVDRFGYYQAAVFIADESERSAYLAETAGPTPAIRTANGSSASGAGQSPSYRSPRTPISRIESGSRSMVGWVMANRMPRVAADVNEEFYYLKDDLLPETRSEVTIPILITDKLLGVLDIQHTQPNAFDAEAIAVLQTIANHIAAVIQNFRLLAAAQSSLDELSSLYYASYQLARAGRPHEVIQVVSDTLERAPYFTALFFVERTALRLVAMSEPKQAASLAEWGLTSKPPAYPELSQLSYEEISRLAMRDEPYLVINSLSAEGTNQDIPSVLVDPVRQAGYKSLAIIFGRSRTHGAATGSQPVNDQGDASLPVQVNHLMILASRQENLNVSGSVGTTASTQLQSYASLTELTTTALEKVHASQRLEKRLAALQTLNAISQAVSVETDLNAFYGVIHREVDNVMGSVNFAIATYDNVTDKIEIPYLYDNKDVRSVPAFPLGEGLTSILIRTRQPLMLVEDTERRTREMGAKLVGAPAKSWLGVPLLVSGDVIGAIIVQDLEHEGRFDEDDKRLLMTLASQVAVAIRNARLLEGTYRQGARQRLLYDITNKIRSSPNLDTILQTTARELSLALGARRADIRIGISQPETAIEEQDQMPVDETLLAVSESPENGMTPEELHPDGEPDVQAASDDVPPSSDETDLPLQGA